MAPRRMWVSDRIDRYENGDTSGNDLDILSVAQKEARDQASKRFTRGEMHILVSIALVAFAPGKGLKLAMPSRRQQWNT